MTTGDLEVTPLGGLGEFGKNCLVIRAAGQAVVVDAGILFPEETFSGIDRIAPDFSALANEKIAAVFLTHGHEDHIGALPLLAARTDAPIHATRFTGELAKRRLADAGSGRAGERIREVRFGSRVQAGPFAVTFLPVSHSVPQSAALLIEAAGRRILHTGDLKIDDDAPAGERTDVGDLAARARGCDLLVLDSTNAERPGSCPSEREARGGLLAAARGVSGRVLVTTFSSHVARLQAGIEAARDSGRGIAILGRSMREIAEIAESEGYLSIPAGLCADPDRLGEIRPERILLLCAGSQGEPRSALSRLSRPAEAEIRLGPGDAAIFSARTIPGRERAVSRLVDGLLRRGVRVLQESDGGPRIHVSGHAYRDDLAAIVRAVAPSAVLPAHGERRALLACASLARESGVPGDAVHVCDNGDSLWLGRATRLAPGARPARAVYLDAADGAEVPEDRIRERRILGARGVVVVTVSARGGVCSIDVASRGVAADPDEVEAAVSREVRGALAGLPPAEPADADRLRSEAESAARAACRRELGIHPMVIARCSR